MHQCRSSSESVSRQPASYDDPCAPHTAPAMDVHQLAAFDVAINRVKNRARYRRGRGYRAIPNGKALMRDRTDPGGIGVQTLLRLRQINEGRHPGMQQGADLRVRGLCILVSGVFPCQQFAGHHPVTLCNRLHHHVCDRTMIQRTFESHTMICVECSGSCAPCLFGATRGAPLSTRS